MDMVVNQASLKRNGVQDYVSLRATALILTAYSLFIIGYFLTTPQVTFEAWQGLFSNLAVKVFTLAALASMMIHTQIGLWQVLTDYVKCAKLRSFLGFVLNMMSFVYVAVGLFILWGV
jgi:succinate dehydrogenase / fumarate reductase membrane anchor subunit